MPSFVIIYLECPGSIADTNSASVFGAFEEAQRRLNFGAVSIFASSICHCNIITLVDVKMLLVGIIGQFFDVEFDLAASERLEGMKVVNIKASSPLVTV